MLYFSFFFFLYLYNIKYLYKLYFHILSRTSYINISLQNINIHLYDNTHMIRLVLLWSQQWRRMIIIMMIKVKIIIHLNSFFIITHICSQSSYKSHITHIQLTCLLFILHTLFSLLSSCSIISFTFKEKTLKKYFMYSRIPFYVALFIGLGRNIPSSATTCNFAALD